MYKILFSRQAQKDAAKIKKSNLHKKCQKLLDLVVQDPLATFPCYEKLVGDLDGFYSRRINIQHRLIYQIDEINKLIKILRMWTHYE